MADRLYEKYEEVYLQQAELFEEAAVAGVRTAIGGFNRGYLQMLRSVVMPRRSSSQVNANSNASSSNQQQLIGVQEEIDVARELAQRQLATALANGFGALANLPLPSPLTGVPNQPSVSGTFNQANAEQEDVNGSANNSDDDSVSIKSEDSSECESDCESHSDDMEIKEEATEEDTNEIVATNCTTSGNVNPNLDNVSVKMEIESECESSDSESSNDEEVFTSGQIKDENDNAEAIDQLMDDFEEQVNIDTQEENTVNEQVDNSLNNNLNVEEQGDSRAVDFNVNDEQQSDAETIIDEASAQAASNEPVQAIPAVDFASLPSTSTGRRRSTRAKKKINYTVALIEDSFAGDSTVNGNGKSTKRLSRKLSTPKRAHAEPEVAAEDDGDEEGSVSLSVIVQYLKCPATGCKARCTDKTQLNGHLLAKHKMKKYRCRVKGCSQSFAKQDQLSDHLKLAHRKLKNWPCDKCETTCKSYKELSSHFGDCQQKGRFQCSADRCDFTCKTRKGVKNHQRKHSSVKYECTFANCTVSFRQKSHLTRHLRIHAQERPFACEQCPMAFTTNWELTRHERTHSGLKPYICTWPGCDYSSSDRSNVIRHVRTLHFGLPASKKEQMERRIIDTRDVGEFVEKTASN